MRRDPVRSRGPEDIISSVQVSLQQKLEHRDWMTSTVMIALDTLELGYLTALVSVHSVRGLWTMIVLPFAPAAVVSPVIISKRCTS